jgi:myosin heavy chain 6/7
LECKKWNVKTHDTNLLLPTPFSRKFKNIQVFFRAGVLGQMEEFRDERLSRIMSWMQAWARGFLNRKQFKKLQEQRMALTVVQRALRRYLKLRTWPWWKLWQKVKPLLNASRVEDQIAVSIFKYWDNHPISAHDR